MAAWTQGEIDTLMQYLHLQSASDICIEYQKTHGLSRSYDAVQKKVQQLRDLHKADEILETAKIQVEQALSGASISSALPADLMVPTNMVQREVAQWLADVSASYQGVEIEPVSNPDGQSLVIVLSDNHFGKKTDDFNLEIARERTLSIPTEIVNTHPDSVKRVDEVVLVLAGDHVEGEDIYANQNGGLECPVIMQAQAAAEAYWHLALDLHSTFQCPVNIRTCPGNHGRMSKTADTRSNWDNVVYMMLALLAEQNPELDINVDLNFNEFAIFQVRDKVGCAYHYGTKHLGTPAMTQKMAGWVLSKGIDFLVHGHWHHWGIETYMGRPMMHNGCMCGPDDLAEKMAVEERPRQGYFFVEEGKPIRVFGFCEW